MIEAAEAMGFVCQADVGENSWSKVLLARPAGTPDAEAPVSPGFSIRPLAGADEVSAYVALHRAVFDTENMTEPWRLPTLQRPERHAALDLVATSPDGNLVGFCVCWLGSRMQGGALAGQIEPRGVHPAHRGRGLGRALLTEGVRRLIAHGAQEVFVETDVQRGVALGLYHSLGFRVRHEVLVYRKEYPA